MRTKKMKEILKKTPKKFKLVFIVLTSTKYETTEAIGKQTFKSFNQDCH